MHQTLIYEVSVETETLIDMKVNGHKYKRRTVAGCSLLTGNPNPVTDNYPSERLLRPQSEL